MLIYENGLIKLKKTKINFFNVVNNCLSDSIKLQVTEKFNFFNNSRSKNVNSIIKIIPLTVNSKLLIYKKNSFIKIKIHFIINGINASNLMKLIQFYLFLQNIPIF